MSEPEKMCPRCGVGSESGWPYPSCANFPPGERAEAHLRLCTRFTDDVCEDCAALIEKSPETA